MAKKPSNNKTSTKKTESRSRLGFREAFKSSKSQAKSRIHRQKMQNNNPHRSFRRSYK